MTLADGPAPKGFNLVNGQIQYGSARPLNFRPTRARSTARVADPERFATTPRVTRSVILLFGASLVLGGVLAAVPREIPGMAVATVLGGAWLSLVLAMMLPSRSERAGTELSRRLGQFRSAVNAVGDTPSRDQLEGLVHVANTLQLREQEVAGELTSIRASIDALDLRSRVDAGDLPVVPGAEVAPGDTCHFMAPVRSGRRRADSFGHLLLTSGWLKFRGTFDVSVAWPEVARVERSGMEIVVTLANSRRTLRFACQTTLEAARGGVLAEHLMQAARDDQAPKRRTLLEQPALRAVRPA